MTFVSTYHSLFSFYGQQNWWPADSRFEMMVGAILTQNTSWNNVEKAITYLKAANCLSLEGIAGLKPVALAELIRPAGYFNVKAKRLKNLCHWLVEQGGVRQVDRLSDKQLRRELLSVNGVGPETADDIVLYAFSRPVFVIDTYTRRIFSRLGLIDENETYESLRRLFESVLANEIPEREEQVRVFNEYHALIVIHAKTACRKRPHCDNCCLRRQCPQLINF